MLKDKVINFLNLLSVNPNLVKSYVSNDYAIICLIVKDLDNDETSYFVKSYEELLKSLNYEFTRELIVTMLIDEYKVIEELDNYGQGYFEYLHKLQ